MSSFGERLRLLREKHNLTQDDLGRILNVKKAAISKYETDKISINLDSIKLLAKHFEVPLSHLIGDELEVIKNNKLPLLCTKQTGHPILYHKHIDGYLDVPDYINADYILTAADNSMIGAGILAGDLAICKKADIPRTDKVIVARKSISANSSELTLKYFLNNNEDPVLKAANPDYPDIDYHAEKYTTVGHVAAIIRRNIPGYQEYNNLYTVKIREEWADVLDLATGYGLNADEVKSILNIQWKMIKQLKGQ